MMKKIVGLFVCTLMICSALVSANSVIEKNQGFQIEDSTISERIPVGSYEIQQIDFYNDITIVRYGRLLIPGKPNLTSKVFSIAIPPGAQVLDVEFETGNCIVLPGKHQIGPCGLPRVIGQEDPVQYEREQHQYEENYKSIYSQDAPYPESVGQVVGTGGYRKYNLVDVRIQLAGREGTVREERCQRRDQYAG